MKILAIETSCDETACAVVEDLPARLDPAERAGGRAELKILSSVVASSTEMHKKYGGIVPEIAAREQLKCIVPVLEESLAPFILPPSHAPALQASTKQSSSSFSSRKPLNSISLHSNRLFLGEGRLRETIQRNIDAIAVTVGPGLIGSLLVGVETAKTIAFVTGKPIIPVNHVLAHMYANFIDHPVISGVSEKSLANTNSNKLRDSSTPLRYAQNDIVFPAISLVVSGGHTELYLMKSIKDLVWLGGTLDDAAGECFDKSARLLGFENGGGAAIEAAASKCQMTNDKCQIKLPRPMMKDESLNFSFSGLKTAIVREWKKHHPSVIPSEIEESLSLSENNSRMPACADRRERSLRASGKAGLGRDDMTSAFSFEIQEAITDVLVAKTIKAAEMHNAKSILLSGGVAANNRLREKFTASSSRFTVAIPPVSLCTDNAVAIASYAFFRGKPTNWSEITAKPDLSVENKSLNVA